MKSNRPYEPSFVAGERVVIDGEILTVKYVSWSKEIRSYTYDVEEQPQTFYFERELSKMKEETKNG